MLHYWSCGLGEAIRRKNLFLFRIFPKGQVVGGGVISESKLYEELFWFCPCLDIFSERGGGCLIPNFWRNLEKLIKRDYSKRGWPYFLGAVQGVIQMQAKNNPCIPPFRQRSLLVLVHALITAPAKQSLLSHLNMNVDLWYVLLHLSYVIKHYITISMIHTLLNIHRTRSYKRCCSH